MLFAVVCGIPLGFFAAKHYGGVWDNFSLVASLIGVSIPVFFLAIILKYIFAVQLGLLPTVGRIDVLIELDHPTNFYLLDALIAGDMHALPGRVEAPDPARGRARLDPARDHRPDHARGGARRPERGLRPHRHGEGHVAAASSTAATCSGTRCCRS